MTHCIMYFVQTNMYIVMCGNVWLQAIWFTSQKGTEGNVFGSSDQWNGLGVFLDSFDNDNQVSSLESCFIIYNTSLRTPILYIKILK